MPVIRLNPGQDIFISADRLWRGTPAPPEKKVLIRLAGGRVAGIITGAPAVREKALLAGEEARGKAPVLELPGCTIMPGMIDCHVHLALDGRDFAASRRQWDDREGMRQRIAADLEETLARGIVAVRDGGDLAGAALACRGEMSAADPPRPLVLACGRAIRRQGEYGSFLGPGLTPAELEAAVDHLAALPVDQIKVLVSGIVSFQTYRRVGGVQFSAGELARIVRRARHHGLRVMAHASGDGAVRLAVEAGVDSIEHGYFAGEETLARMAARGIAWIPTVVPVAAQLKENLRAQYSPQEREVIERTCRHQLHLLRLARRLGVKLGVGTDAGATGVPHGRGYLDELLLYHAAGLSTAEILLAATAGGAAVLGRENELGVIAPGKPAFLIAAEGNPWWNIKDLHRVRYVFIPSSF